MLILLRQSIPRIHSSAVAVLLIGFPLRVRAEGATAWTRILIDAGQPRRFDIAPDELHLRAPSGANSLHRITPEPALDQLRARAKRLAAAGGGEVKLVLYPAGRPRDARTRRLLTRKILLLLRPDADPETVLNGVQGLVQWRALDYLPGAVLAESADPTDALELADSVRARPGALWAEAQLASQRPPRFLPNDTLFGSEWHLRNTGQFGSVGVDVNISEVWNTYRGAGIVIGIVDDGLQTGHPD